MTASSEVVKKDKTAEISVRAGIKAFFFHDGRFSKTATFATLGDTLVLFAYVLSWAAGTEIHLGDVATFKLPAFDAGAAVALLSILNGTYVANNLIKSRSAHG